MGHAADVRLAAGPEETWYLEAVFTPGTRLGTRPDDPTTFVQVAEVREVTTIRIPSGRLIVDSPWPEDDDPELTVRVGRELAERIPPGNYRVEAAWTQAPYEFMGERFDGREVAAIRLCITETPVMSWEMAIGVGDDIETIRPGDRIGFTSETNMGSFSDAAAWPALTGPFREFWRRQQAGNRQPRDTESLFDDRFERASEEGHGADLVTFPAEGPSVVWLGRTGTGVIASVAVADGYHSSDRNPSP
ncbi:DUF4241 domain-containing protein [Streptomyces kaniharaensis]|uniref:DUF4241 domain-containing protein n=1 Tax=Streptomyces kaniharaensis TaxID=212423 RepID=A0A6N7L1T3_9ACTN|nr:DUF4241 domain-containing protein [Streptomyces kaniharaensis]MQS16458.1 DUF4241 domain-containing protein [Streptomyces kaniharaensis]